MAEAIPSTPRIGESGAVRCELELVHHVHVGSRAVELCPKLHRAVVVFDGGIAC